MRLRRQPAFFRRCWTFVRVHPDRSGRRLLTERTVKAREHVRQDRRVGMPDVRRVIDVVDGVVNKIWMT